MKCVCCGDPLDDTVMALLCPLCFQSLQSHGTDTRWARCSEHKRLFKVSSTSNRR